MCSPGEFHICVERKLPMEKIVLSGVNKEYEDVRYAMEQGVTIIQQNPEVSWSW